MPVVTISREIGSGGEEIAQAVAERLGAVFLHGQVIAEVARRLQVSEEWAAAHDERPEPFPDRLARTLWLTVPSMMMPSEETLTPPEVSTEAYVKETSRLIREVARMGNAVILGRGAQCILADQPTVLRVRIVAPLPFRIDTLHRRYKISRTEAERRVRAEDARRARYVRDFFDADWSAPYTFHLVLNAAALGQDACTQLILKTLDLIPGGGGQTGGTSV